MTAAAYHTMLCQQMKIELPRDETQEIKSGICFELL